MQKNHYLCKEKHKTGILTLRDSVLFINQQLTLSN